jgi:hypothetical protein
LFYVLNQVIKWLCSFINEDSPSPAPFGSTSKVLRRQMFRQVACPSAIQCDNLKQLIQRLLALMEEYHDDVSL